MKSLLILILVSSPAAASFTFHFGDRPRTLEVNGEEETLLVFPSAPFTRVCQPSGIVDLSTLGSAAEAQNLLPAGNRYDYFNRLAAGNSSTEAKPEDNGREALSKLLKLTPLRNGAATVCAVKLVTGETVMVRFALQSQIQRPAVEFKPASSFEAPGDFASNLTGLTAFRDLIQGGDLTYLLEVTPTFASMSTENGDYKIVYLGTDSKSISAWHIRGKAKKEFTPPRQIKTDFVGQILFSAWQPRVDYKPGDEFDFWLLSSHDFSRDELSLRLP
jgi:hypothetical protein